MKSRRPPATRGYTLVEVLIAMVLTGMVVAGTLRALSAQKKFYARQARILEARHALRATTTILSSELRDLSANSGDLYTIASDSVALRSTTAFGVVCGVNEGSGLIALTHASGHFRLLGSADSLLVFVENGIRDDDDTWRALPVDLIAKTGLQCDSGNWPDRVITVAGDLSGIWVGAPVRLFYPYVFGLFSMDQRWWLGRRLRVAGSDYVPVAGPLAPPDSGGLQLQYYRQDGSLTANPGEVVRVSIDVRAPAMRSLDDPDYRGFRTSTHLRN